MSLVIAGLFMNALSTVTEAALICYLIDVVSSRSDLRILETCLEMPDLTSLSNRSLRKMQKMRE